MVNKYLSIYLYELTGRWKKIPVCKRVNISLCPYKITTT